MVASILNAVVQILIWERLMLSQVLMLQSSVIYTDGCQLISAEGLETIRGMLMLKKPKPQSGRMKPLSQISFK